jgi:hypothetical protein
MAISQFENKVFYKGEAEAIRNAHELWQQMADTESGKSAEHLPDFVKGEYEYLSGIRITGDHIQFLSRFSPNEEVLLLIAKHLKVEYVHIYYNDEYLFYGVHMIIDKEYKEFEMEEYDYLLYDLTSEGKFSFEGITFEHRIPIFEHIVNRKITAANIPITWPPFYYDF